MDISAADRFAIQDLYAKWCRTVDTCDAEGKDIKRLTNDPAFDNKLNFPALMAGYSQFFGTQEQPNKPARSAVQVAALVAPGALLEIEVIAAKRR